MLAALLLNVNTRPDGGDDAWRRLPRKARREIERRRREAQRKYIESENAKKQDELNLHSTIKNLYDELLGIPSAKPKAQALVAPYVREADRPATVDNVDFAQVIRQFTIMRQLYILQERELDDELAILLLMD